MIEICDVCNNRVLYSGPSGMPRVTVPGLPVALAEELMLNSRFNSTGELQAIWLKNPLLSFSEAFIPR